MLVANMLSIKINNINIISDRLNFNKTILPYIKYVY